MQNRYQNREIYFNELVITCREYYIPYVSKYKSINSEISIFEIGCGEGGNLLPFAEIGCRVVGVDIDERRINFAKDFFAKNKIKGTFIYSDIFKLDLQEQFDLIIIHDVIEHINDKEKLLTELKRYLKPDGHAFVGFPPWYMPFGGHQQMSSSRLISRTPFVHLLPRNFYRWILKKSGHSVNHIDGFLDIKDCGISIEKYQQLVKDNGYELLNIKLFFINPHYQTKFGLKPRKLNRFIAKIPFFRNFFSTSCWSIIRKY